MDSNIENMQNPLVFVKCMTFNQANYIEDAMKGFVMQKTEFPFVVSVMDDASTDGEPEVIKRFLEKEFDMDSAITHETDERIRVVARHKTNENCIFLVFYLKYNHYSIQKPKWKYFWNWRKNVKYIALCEGDDYWTDPYKLQKQVDYMEGHEDVGLCYTDYDVCDDKGVVKYQSCFESKIFKPILSFEEMLLSAGYIAPMTWMFRRNIWDKVKDNMINVKTDGTYVKAMEFFLISEVSYLPYTTATYRVNNGSASHPLSIEGRFKYRKGVYDTQSYYASKYLHVPYFLVMLKRLEIDELLPLAIKAGIDDYVDDCKSFAKDNAIDISQYFQRERMLTELSEIRKSKAYRLGKFILKPLRMFRRNV